MAVEIESTDAGLVVANIGDLSSMNVDLEECLSWFEQTEQEEELASSDET
jgi:hypothetical protein